MLKGEKLKAFPAKFGTRVSTLFTPFQYSIWSVRAMRQVKEIKGITIKEEIKVSLFSDDIILYIKKDPKDSTTNVRQIY